MLIAFVLLVAAAASLVLTPMVRALAHRIGAVDAPGVRKVHASAVPRLGGVAVGAAGLVGLSAAVALQHATGLGPGNPAGGAAAPLIAGGSVVFAVGVRDDIRGLTPLAKLAGISVAALIVIASGVAIERVTLFEQTYRLGWLAWPTTFAWIVGVTNAFNLIDGLDGLATGLAVIAATACSLVLLLRGDAQNAIVLVSLVGAGIGFLPYNFNPATIFLGDCGSLLFGFVLAVTAITGYQKGATALAVGAPLLALALPILDVVGSIARRVAGRRPIFAPDQRHIHHWLLQLGLSHRSAVLVLYACAIALASLAVATADYR